MRLVVDTNVFVSAALKDTSWSAIVVRWLDHHGGLLKSLATEQEVVAVLQRPRITCKIPPFFLENVQRIFALAELVTITQTVRECRDSKDDKFLELGVNGHADVIISGDGDLLVLGSFRNIPIITPATFGRARSR